MSVYYGEPPQGSDTRVSRWREYRRPIIVTVVIAVLVVGVLGFFLATAKTDRDVVGVVYGGGPFEGRHYQQTMEPGTGLTFVGWFDPVYRYPVTQRSYIISLTEGDVQAEVQAPTANRITAGFQVATYFRLNTDVLREFHEVVGLKYAAWTSEGWNRMLAESFKQQIEFAIAREAREWDDAELYADPAALTTIATNVGRNLKENVAQVLGGEYFCGVEFVPGEACPDFTFVIKAITLPPDIIASYEANRESAIAVQTKTNEVLQRQQEAESIRTLNEALEEAGEDYVLLRAIEEGQIDFWVIPSDTDLTLTTPPTPTE